MEGAFLRFYVDEKQTHRGLMVWEWLLEKANALGIRGGSAFHATGGFGRHHSLHEDQFFEQAGSIGVEVEFIVTDDESKKLLSLIREEKIRLFYARIPASFAVINPDEDDLPDVVLDE